MSAPAFEAAVRRVSASSSGRGLGAARRVGSAHRVARVSHRQHASFRTARAERVRRRGAAAAPCAEKYAVSTEDATAMFDARFPPGSVPVAVRETACGRGLVALRPIDEGDLLLSIPWRHTVHVFEDGDDDPDDLRLALELLRVLDDGGDGPEDERVGIWRDYRPMLPSSTGAAAFWTKENVDELQHADSVDETRGQKTQQKRYSVGALVSTLQVVQRRDPGRHSEGVGAFRGPVQPQIRVARAGATNGRFVTSRAARE